MNDRLMTLRRKANAKPPLMLVIGWTVVTIAIWVAVNNAAGRLVWLW
ncbi:hypothetical protein [Methylobacterium sp. J-070]|nr:hypothetical protein [Methylobacterium sp. J-070]MCJ2049534.1 hypothetical protein [Methylobacterium sp. J-070]